MNAAPENQFEFRQVYECAPLLTDPYTRVRNSTTGNPEDAWFEYYYGARDVGLNYTYSFQNTTKFDQDDKLDFSNGNADYKIG